MYAGGISDSAGVARIQELIPLELEIPYDLASSFSFDD